MPAACEIVHIPFTSAPGASDGGTQAQRRPSRRFNTIHNALQAITVLEARDKGIAVQWSSRRGCADVSSRPFVDCTICFSALQVNFIYIEAGQRRQALVKLRVCPGCAHKLNYKKEKQYRKASSAAAAVQESQGAKRARRGDAEAHAEAQDAVERHPGSIWDPTSYAPSEPAIMPAGAVKGLPSTTGAEPELGAAAVCVMPGDDSMWETKRKVEEATAEEEVDEYFAGLFD